MKLYLIAFLLIALQACNNTDIQPEINGAYIGTFERGSNSSNVELNFNDGVYSGNGDKEKFPAICEGTYSNTTDIIRFQNTCAWTAEFDHSLILGGEWNYIIEQNKLLLTSADRGKYTLTKQ